ncbi:MAG: head GIN domain-containing protein [Bacteroidota bacterium]
MKRITLLLFVIIPTLAFSQKTERQLPSFYAISAFGPFEVELIKGDANAVILSGGEWDHDRVITEVRGNILKIKVENKALWNDTDHKRPVKVYLTYKESLEWVKSSAGALVYTKEVIKTDDIELEATAGGEMDLRLEVENLKMKVTSGAIVELEGLAKYQTVTVNTGGEIYGYNLKSKYADVRANTGGVVDVTAIKELDAFAGLGGVINYRGNPERYDIDTSLGGEVYSKK